MHPPTIDLDINSEMESQFPNLACTHGGFNSSYQVKATTEKWP